MHTCKQCGGSIGGAFRYCPWCAAPQRAKLVEFFGGTGDESGKALRVSRYTHEGHVRFSVWDESGTAEAAVSVDEAEAARLASFLVGPRRQPSLLERLGL
ncbi:MAG: hypothetical protein H0V45_08115 [Actinobacteria bacterium]|nr:hypothetical protein [Actinomycetota bacterium]